MRVPEAAGVGSADVVVSFDAWKEGAVSTTRHQVQVAAPKTTRKLEPVSSRLTRELIHPNKSAGLTSVTLSPDGRRIIAGDYPGGVVVVWDVASGKQLVEIETGYGYRASSEYFHISPDWKTLFVSHGKRKYQRVEQDGKSLLRWEFNGAVRAWDLDTGQLKRTYQHKPTRYIGYLQLSPDGTRFVTSDLLSGLGDAKQALSLWDVESGRYRPLPEALGSVTYSPDNRTLAICATNKDNYTTAVKLLDVVTGKEKLSIPVADENTHAHVSAFSPDGKLMVMNYRVFAQAKKWDKSQCWLKWWRTETGQEIMSLPGENGDIFFDCRFSPDGGRVAAINWGSENRKLLLLRTAD